MLYDAFGYSMVRSREALKDTHNKKAQKWFKPTQIRFYVQDFISQKGIRAQLVDENDEEVIFEPRVLPGNGIAGNISGYQYRILKIFKGGLPPPVTESRKGYYRQDHLKSYQPMLLNLSNDGAGVITAKPNLVYLWDIIKNQVILYFAVPKSALSYASTPLTILTNPIMNMKQNTIKEEPQDVETIGEQQEAEIKNDIRRTNTTSTRI